MIETQIAQIAAALPVSDSGKISGKPETSLQFVNMVSTRLGKPLCQKSHDHFVDLPFVTKKKDPGRPTITCSIGPHVFHNAFCDLGASINVMSKVIYDKILGGPLSTTKFRLLMANQTSRHPEGLAQDILVRIRDTYIPTDFVILDMGCNEEVPLLLGKPFLNTTNAVLHVGSGHVCFHIQGQTIRCQFNGFKTYINTLKTNSPRNNHVKESNRYGK